MGFVTYDLTGGPMWRDLLADMSDADFARLVRDGLTLFSEEGPMPIHDDHVRTQMGQSPVHRDRQPSEILEDIRNSIVRLAASERPDFDQVGRLAFNALAIEAGIRQGELRQMNDNAYAELARLRDRLAEVERALHPLEAVTTTVDFDADPAPHMSLEDARRNCTCGVFNQTGPMTSLNDCPVHGTTSTTTIDPRPWIDESVRQARARRPVTDSPQA